MVGLEQEVLGFGVDDVMTVLPAIVVINCSLEQRHLVVRLVALEAFKLFVERRSRILPLDQLRP